jgi:DNA-binding HxlR family transcriptional regulator
LEVFIGKLVNYRRLRVSTIQEDVLAGHGAPRRTTTRRRDRRVVARREVLLHEWRGDPQEPEPGRESVLRHLGDASGPRSRHRGDRDSGDRQCNAPAPCGALRCPGVARECGRRRSHGPVQRTQCGTGTLATLCGDAQHDKEQGTAQCGTIQQDPDTSVTELLAPSAASAANCVNFQRAIEFIGRRWLGVILYVLLDGPCRFNELLATIPNLSDRLLTERLRELEAAGMVTREVQPGPPVRVVYELTEAGRSLTGIIHDIAQWGHVWLDGRLDV